MTLEEKRALAMARMRQTLECFGLGTTVGWTGGKDSTVVLALWRVVLAEHAPEARVRALNLDTGCKFPEVLAFRDRLARDWNIDLHIIRPSVPLSRYPLARDPLTCCRDLKVVPLNNALQNLGISALLTGVRADENPNRAGHPWLEEHVDPVHVRAAPILEWTELDVWTFLVREGIPWCPLYDEGYRSLGCMPCTSRSGHGERSGRDSRKEEHMGQLRSLGYF
ncbi:MAG: phosphoadenosine phosphosulfate reductase [Deltaproteobacteria bacterium]|nr:phosphoadenosine phosphosulfate reductase [Deltaproteobacteria bacterium]